MACLHELLSGQLTNIVLLGPLVASHVAWPSHALLRVREATAMIGHAKRPLASVSTISTSGVLEAPTPGTGIPTGVLVCGVVVLVLLDFFFEFGDSLFRCTWKRLFFPRITIKFKHEKIVADA